MPTIRHLKLPFECNVKELQIELEAILQQKWIPHFNTEGYEGNWKSIALYAPQGDAANILAHNSESLQETAALKGSPYLRHIIGQFKCPLLSVRLLKLDRGAYIKPHRDYQLGYEDGTFRIHIPIITNPQVAFILDGERLDMKVGECWYTNVNFVHAVANDGDCDRIHLVLDGERNAWSDELFFSLAPKESFFPTSTNNYSLATIQQMLQELEGMETEGAKQLIIELQNKIKELNTT